MPKSQAQVRLAHAVLEGSANDMPKNVAQEFVRGIHGKKAGKLPNKVKKKNR